MSDQQPHKIIASGIKPDPAPGSLFLWRGPQEYFDFDGLDRKHLPALYEPIVPSTFRHIPQSICPFCRRNLGEDEWSIVSQGFHYNMLCPMCGFNFEHHLEYYITNAFPSVHRFYCSTLRQFEINDSALTLQELGSHLRRRFRDVYSLSPRRFELLIADAFRNQGFEVRLTKTTRDGGYDLHLLESSSGTQVLVECKRYRKDRKVGVAPVRQLLGVQVREGVRRATLITTSGFTTGAKEESLQARNTSGFSIQLMDADDILRALSVYNALLPPLDLHPVLRAK